MGHMIAVAMQKGGVGKTTTAINLATGMALGDYEVLLVDLDPQANASHGLGIELNDSNPGLSDLLFGHEQAGDVLRPSGIDGLDVIPASLDLNGARAELPRQQSEYNELKKGLRDVRTRYDWILVDCPPSLGPLTLNALKAVDSIFIPMQCEYYALEGLSQLWNTVNRIQDQFNPALDCLGILLTMFDSRTNLAEDVRDEAVSYFGELVLDTVIPRNIRISEAPGFGKPVIVHDPTCRGSVAYLKATEEVITRERQRTREGAGRPAAGSRSQR